MYTCYIDEAGCPGVFPSESSIIQPALAIAGLSLHHTSIRALSQHFIKLKQMYLYGSKRSLLLEDDLPVELKGADLRQAIRTPGSQNARNAHHFLHQLMDMLIIHEAQLFGSVLIKSPGEEFDGNRIYSAAMQEIAYSFHQQLELRDDSGSIVADFREPKINTLVSKDIAAKMLKNNSNSFPRFYEPPTFGMSNNHVGIQIADILVSTLLFPLALCEHGKEIPYGKYRVAEDSTLFRCYRKRLLALSNRGSSISVIHAKNLNDRHCFAQTRPQNRVRKAEIMRAA
jgi:hypothetical protein